MTIESLNDSLFLLINASASPPPSLLATARLCADGLIWLVPAVLVAGWLRGRERTRKWLLEAAAAGLLGLFINQLIGLAWMHPRPFMIGLGHTFIPHAADSSFPSDHVTLTWAVAASLLAHRRTRAAGAALGLLCMPLAWSRIYLGVHFPLDMLGAILVASLSAWLCRRNGRWLVERPYQLLNPAYRLVFAALIRRGWVNT